MHRLRSMLFPGGENGDYENLLPEQILFGRERLATTRVQWEGGHSFEKVLLHCQKKLNRLLVS